MANPVSAGCPLPPSSRSMTERSLPWRRTSWDFKTFSDLSRPLNLCWTSNTKLQNTGKQNDNNNKPTKTSRSRSMIIATFHSDFEQNPGPQFELGFKIPRMFSFTFPLQGSTEGKRGMYWQRWTNQSNGLQKMRNEIDKERERERERFAIEW